MKRTPLKRKTPLKSNKLVDIIKGNDPAIIDKLKARGLVKKASTLSTKRKATGEKEVFRKIWESREHKCLTCSAYIKEAKAINFSHLLPKGKYPEYRLDEKNIVLQCEDCHTKWHYHGKMMREFKRWSTFFARHDDMWEKAYPESTRP